MTTTDNNKIQLTDDGIDLGDAYTRVVDEYRSYDIDVEHEDERRIIFVDTSRYDIGEWAADLGESWDDVNRVVHSVADACVDNAHLVFSAVDPIVFVKPGVPA